MKLPSDLKIFLSIIKNDLPKTLSRAVLGIYIYGSISYGNFAKNRSDVDVLVVLKRKLNNKEFTKLKKFFARLDLKNNHWFKRLEMDFAVLSELDFKAVIKTVHFSGGKLKKRADSGAHNPITWINLRDCGVVLFGPRPKAFAPKVSDKILFEALRGEFKYLQKHSVEWKKIDLWNQVYIIATLCRIVFTFQKKKIVSKKFALEWCGKNLPTVYRQTARLALKHLDDFEHPLDKRLNARITKLMKRVDGLMALSVSSCRRG